MEQLPKLGRQVLKRNHLGFDPLALLQNTTFPNDRFEQILLISRKARRNAILGLRIDADDIEWKKIQSYETPRSIYHKPDLGLIEHERYVKRRTQLAKTAAAITAQALARGWIIRRKFTKLISYKYSTVANGNPELDEIEFPAFDLTSQELMDIKYQKFCIHYEKMTGRMPHYADFASSLISSSWKRYKFHKLYTRYQQKMKEVAHPACSLSLGPSRISLQIISNACVVD